MGSAEGVGGSIFFLRSCNKSGRGSQGQLRAVEPSPAPPPPPSHTLLHPRSIHPKSSPLLSTSFPAAMIHFELKRQSPCELTGRWSARPFGAHGRAFSPEWHLGSLKSPCALCPRLTKEINDWWRKGCFGGSGLM